MKDAGSNFGDLNDEEVNEAKFFYQNTAGDETIFIRDVFCLLQRRLFFHISLIGYTLTYTLE
jgi:hypothetical protein